MERKRKSEYVLYLPSTWDGFWDNKGMKVSHCIVGLDVVRVGKK